MQNLLNDLDLAQLQLLKKVVSNAMLHPEEDKYRTLKHTNESCKTKILSIAKMTSVLALVGFKFNSEGDFHLADGKLLPPFATAISTAIDTFQNRSDFEYEERKRALQDQQVERERKLQQDKLNQQAELLKIKHIQADVHARPVVASHADSTMGHAAAAEGIFAGAGGKSSKAKTFKDIGGGGDRC